jgi:cytochrome c7-like protein
MNRLLVLVAAGLLAAGCTKGAAKAVTAAAPEQPAVDFTHEPHVAAQLACTDCHEGIDKATRLEAGVRHVKVACGDCHDDDRKDFKVPARVKPVRFTFSHANHLPKVKDCSACHKALPEMGDKEIKSPPMAACTSCHKHQLDFQQARCTPCHTDLKGWKPESAFAHTGDWLRAHGRYASPSAESCAACHDQTYCSDCHSAQTAPARPSIVFPEAVKREFIHRGDYVSRHMIEAGANPASCRKCHGSPFCDSCHTQQNLTLKTLDPRNVHPAGWANDKSSGHFHGDAARRDVVSCAGCHDNGAAAICVACHQVGGFVGKSPHPKSFARKHDQGDISGNAMCRACHH